MINRRKKCYNNGMKLTKRLTLIFCLVFWASSVWAFDFVILKYRTGDWYNARDGVKNFLTELKKRTTLDVSLQAVELGLEEDRIFDYSFLFLNGHVPAQFNKPEALNLRKFVLGGGFVFVNDDYGMDASFRKAVAEIFPEYRFEEVAFDDEIYSCFYTFQRGLPKIHEHDGGAPRGYALWVENRIALFYAANTDIADGWDDYEVHKDPPEVRESAIRMGVNIVVYALTH